MSCIDFDRLLDLKLICSDTGEYSLCKVPILNLTMNNYCTFFDHRYADKGLTLFWSLVKHCSPCKLYILCLDKKTEIVLSALCRDEIVIVSLDELLLWDQNLANAKSDRSLVEFYFTCKPSLCLFIFAKYYDVSSLIYLDSDIYYCGDQGKIDEEMKNHSVGLTPHRFQRNLRVINKVKGSGRFNAGWIMFRNDENGRSCLQWWRERCLEWCHDRVDGGRYADQGYLELMPDLFSGVKAIENEGVNSGPWNIYCHNVREYDGDVYIDDSKLVCYHYHGLKEIGYGLWETGTAAFKHRIGTDSKNIIYKKYFMELLAQRNFCDNIIGRSEQNQIRAYKTKIDVWFKDMPGLFRVMKILFVILSGLLFNSLLTSSRRDLV